MPTFCMLVSAISLTIFLGLIAYDGWSIGVLVFGVVVSLIMLLQFIVYGVDQFVTSTSQIWKTVAVSMVDVIQGIRGLRGES